MKNGELLNLASQEFDVFVTADQNLEHQQNIAALRLAVGGSLGPRDGRRLLRVDGAAESDHGATQTPPLFASMRCTSPPGPR